jgi:hypothetical protein
MKAANIILLTILSLVLIVAIIFFAGTPTGRAIVNNWRFSLQKVDDVTLYEKRKEVEDACRAMMASYNADKLTYEQYRGSDNPEKKSWAEQAKMRANKTASTYNEYVLKNSFVWKDNVPADIYMKLEYITD